jgi:deoxyribodipyrimidine photo-lyase
MSVIYWFRRDLRLQDHPALNAAFQSGEDVHCVSTADILGQPFSQLAEIRKNSLRSSWLKLLNSVDGKLSILKSPNDLVRVARHVGAKKVFVSEVFDTFGVKELAAVERDLAEFGIDLVRGPGNYAVAPGTVRKPDGSPYRVYTPFFNVWSQCELQLPYSLPTSAEFKELVDFESEFNPQLELGVNTIAGEPQALATLARFLDTRVMNYGEDRNFAALGGTSHLSHALSHGEIHPRTILANLPTGSGAEVFRKEIAWREFYADVLWQRPDTFDGYYDQKFVGMKYDDPGQKFEAWKSGNTGYPMVDAGMRQLSKTGWMHNRVRMIVASFLVKDLHIEWQHGATWFQENLTDFDPASNSHGWQWTAGCGTDASPFYRVFNPVGQGLKFDPDGDYVRRYVPELRHLHGSSVHEPWNFSDGYSLGYSERIIDHATERIEALARLEQLKVQ